jgi:hypothetical protein
VAWPRSGFHSASAAAGLKDDTLHDPHLLPPPDEIAAEIVENLEAALGAFARSRCAYE